MKHASAVITVALLVSMTFFSAQVAWTEDAGAWKLDKINGDDDSYNATFNIGGGEDTDAVIVVPYDVPVYDARMGLSGLGDARLRSHGGIAESLVPFILSSPPGETLLEKAAHTGVRNFDIFAFALAAASYIA